MSASVVTATPIAGVPMGAPVGPAVEAGSTGRRPGCPHTTTVHHRTTRSPTMFQALYADLARAHRTRRQREYQRRLEAQTQHEMLLAMPRMLAR